MARKQRFVVNFERMKKEIFLSKASNANAGIAGNPDFTNAPVSPSDFKSAFERMVEAAPNAVPYNIEGLRVFKPLRLIVEGMMADLGEFAQSTIGDNPERMAICGLPLTKEPAARPQDINEEVQRPRVEPGNTADKIAISVRSNRAADGIIVEERQPDLSYKEVAKVVGFKTTLSGYATDAVAVLQIRYWNNSGKGPRMGRPMAVVV